MAHNLAATGQPRGFSVAHWDDQFGEIALQPLRQSGVGCFARAGKHSRRGEDGAYGDFASVRDGATW